MLRRRTLRVNRNVEHNIDYRVSFSDADPKPKVDYNYQLRLWGLTEAPGISVFTKDGDQICLTYSTYERGLTG